MLEIMDILKSEIQYFKKLKTAIGDLHGHIHSLAVKVAQLHLSEKYSNVKQWEVSEKYGSGMDIIGECDGNVLVVAEVKTTFRAEKESLGSQQRTKIKEDIDKLIASDAVHKYLFVIDDKNKKAISGILHGYNGVGIELVNIFDV